MVILNILVHSLSKVVHTAKISDLEIHYLLTVTTIFFNFIMIFLGILVLVDTSDWNKINENSS